MLTSEYKERKNWENGKKTVDQCQSKLLFVSSMLYRGIIMIYV